MLFWWNWALWKLNWSRQQVTMLSLYLQLLKTGASYWNIIQYPVSMCSWGSVNNWELYGASHLQELALLGQMNMMKSQNCFPTLSSDVLYRSICTKVINFEYVCLFLRIKSEKLLLIYVICACNSELSLLLQWFIYRVSGWKDFFF